MTLQTDFKRITRSGFLNFYRNAVVSVTSVLMMTVTLLVIGVIIFVNAILGYTRAGLEQKVDVNIYFYPGASESQIIEVQKNLEQLPEVAEVTYISRADALADFKRRHANDYLTLQALDELGTNPLGASLAIRANDSADYEHIADVITGETSLVQGSQNIIEKINYYQNRDIINRLNQIMTSVNSIGIALTLFFVIISILITYNTIRLAIYMAREEITVMRLVGAENKYIQGPFIIEGMLYGVVAAAISIILFFPITLWFTNHTEVFLGGFRLVAYYGDNIVQIFFILLALGVLLGILSAALATRQYLKK